MTSDQALLRSIVLESVPMKRRHSRPGRQIYERVDSVYGSLSERRFWRVLNKLVASGAVRRVGTLHVSSEYYREET